MTSTVALTETAIQFFWTMSSSSWRSHSQTADVVALLDSISTSEKFTQAVQGHPLRSQWVPPPPTRFDEKRDSSQMHEFISSLQIPKVGNLKFPAMLLHRLGSLMVEEDLRERKEDIFSGNNTFLLNTSGSGKTRLLFEGLCDNWGLYFTSHLDSGSLGSSDLEVNIIKHLQKRTDFVLFPSLLPEPDATQAIALNEQHAHHTNDLGGVSQERQKFWLHFQLRPNIQSECDKYTEHFADVFLELSEALSDAEVDDAIIDDAIGQTAREILVALGGSAKLFVVLDEANVAAQNCEESFRDDHGRYHPVLKVMLQTWREHLKDLPFSFVVAGTEIPQQYFCDPEWADFIWSSNTGGFNSQECQKHYSQQFFPDDVWESIGEALALRMWRWIRGRHRFTAAFIAVLLEHSYAKPPTYLDMFVEQGTGYFPHDATYDIRPPSGILPFLQLDFSRMRIDRELRSYVHLALMDTLLSPVNPGYSGDAIKLVNEGIGRFVDSRCLHIVVDEPLIIARAVTWFSGDEGEMPASILKYQYFLDHLVDPAMVPRHPPAYLTFALALAFCKSRRISDIFALSKPIPIWSRRNTDIVVLKQDGDNVVESPLRHVDRIQRTLVTYSTTIADTLSWMRHYYRTPFCIHVTETTATLIFVVKLSNNTRFWAIMRVLHSLADEDVATKIRDTAHDLQAENFFREPASLLFILVSVLIDDVVSRTPTNHLQIF
ncbi:hypothetical protein WG66_013378 [Moniliophthora roreri]|nr:hypothetical protein WG66_013378 [Moniliophthora roreri]